MLLTFELSFGLSFIKLPNQDSRFDFNRFAKKEFKSIRSQGTESKPFNRRSSFVESQTKLNSCAEQFINLIRCVISEECDVSSDLATDLEKLLDKLLTKDQTKDENNNDQQFLTTRTDQLINPRTAEDLDAYLLQLIAATKSALDDVCNENSNQFFDSSSFNFTDQTLVSPISSSGSTSTSSDHPKESEKPNEIGYLRTLNNGKLLLYKDQLQQTIRKLSADLVDELEAKDSIYLKRDELFLRIENLTRQW